jgi:hypothetical protein
VADEIRENCPEVDSLISNVKKIFLKASQRVEKFKEDSPSFPLTTQPVLTH